MSNPFSWRWLRRQSNERDALLADLQSSWQEQLVTAMRRVLDDESVSSSQAIARLAELDGRQLLALDLALRNVSRWRYDAERAVLQSGPPEPHDEATETALLFVAASSASGFIREDALRHFRNYPGPLALAAAILRAEDWVPPVQRAASALFDELMRSHHASALFWWLDLVGTMQGKQRFAGMWRDTIEPELLAPQHRAERWQCVTRGAAPTRRFAFQLVAKADPDRFTQALQRALEDASPLVASWALTQMHSVADPQTRQALLETASRHRATAVRADAIRRIAVSDAPDARDRLRGALFDRSRAPRNAAAYYLQHRFHESAADHWRKSLDRNEHVASATLGLSEHGAAADIARLRRQLAHRTSAVRAAVLRGLSQVGDPHLRERLLVALRDPAVLVVRTATVLLHRLPEGMDRETLSAAIQQGARVELRRVLISAAVHLPKWDGLSLLLDQLADGPPQDHAHVATVIDRWAMASMRRFTPLPDAMRAPLIARLAHVRGRLPHKRWQDLSQSLKAN